MGQLIQSSLTNQTNI